MNPRLAIILGIVAVAVVAAVVALLVLPRSEIAPVADPVPTIAAPDVDPSPIDSSTPSATAGTYLDYSEAAVAAAEGRVLLFFHASWCPQCRAIEDDILAQGVPAGVTILHVDYDSNQALRQRYGVTLQTTFVEVDSSGDPLQSHVAYDDPSLDAVVAAML
ncbi:thioredoxin family protein [Pseudolysinimonas sp.]|jgi:thiol-disulfide isomerase/thioredoxin|uniref:thioredoxin family protein n=1 Tax=Pseudolysinimonas sp. TaxID=2680009 RepID=UPI0037841A65